jgi:deoxyadenosine/deoxycytidine kinase
MKIKTMNKKTGKIIAVVGGPRSGKSFLSCLLAKHYNAKVILEGEEVDFPERIREDIEKNIRSLERILWFRNMLARKYLQALEYREKKKTVILDTFWMSYRLHIDALISGFPKEVISEVAEIDERLLGYPDVIIFLNTKEKMIRKFIKLGGRKFDNSEKFIIEQALPIQKLHQEFLEKYDNPAGKLIIVPRDTLDFEKPSDFQDIINRIEE